MILITASSKGTVLARLWMFWALSRTLTMFKCHEGHPLLTIAALRTKIKMKSKMAFNEDKRNF